MALEEYKRKRRFEETPEPPPKVEKKTAHRFVVQKHRATRLHYDFRLELEGVLKSWAVPRGPSLDPADKRLAMQVEDHPVSYFDFEGNIPEDNYGAGTVQVWDVGTWQPLSPVAVKGKYVPGTDAEALAMLAKGDLKFRLKGKRLKGDFALVHIKSRRSDSKGNEWLMIKKHDDDVVEDFDIEQYDSSVLTKRTLEEIAGDAGSREWKSRPTSRGRVKAAWLTDAIAKLDQKKKAAAKSGKAAPKVQPAKKEGKKAQTAAPKEKTQPPAPPEKPPAPLKASRGAASSSLFKTLPGAVPATMLTKVHPMLATSADKPFDHPDWLFEIKWDGYRAVAFIHDGKVRLVSRNQNDLTEKFSELAGMAKHVKAKDAVIDGEIVALDPEGRPSFSLMQQRTGFRPGGKRMPGLAGVPVQYFAFDLLYADGYDLRRVPLEQRKQALAAIITPDEVLRYSDHYPAQGKALFELARQRGLEGIVGKRRNSAYVETRSSDWVKIKITRRLECVIGGYTDPEGSRDYFGSIVLGLYDQQGRLIHVGQAGSGFDQQGLQAVWERLKKLESKKNPFHGPVEALRAVHFVKPALVAEIKFSEWTHERAESGPKLRAPVFMGLRDDKKPEECVFEQEGDDEPGSGL